MKFVKKSLKFGEYILTRVFLRTTPYSYNLIQNSLLVKQRLSGLLASHFIKYY